MANIIAKQPFNWAQLLDNKSPFVELFLGGIREAYWAENHLVTTLLKMTKAASGDLQEILSRHVEQTKSHANRLEHVFELLDEIIEARRNPSIAGLGIEANEAIEYTEEGTATRDLAIILVCQKIEQYEIATYGGLIKLAVTIGREDVADMLAEIINDEIECNELLSNQSQIIPMRAAEEN